ncbi:hypothetical protein CAOG_03443 [Capsaspora owczarzaki ATCC 30864]|uniref:L-type lectin-like domain-containing protein n=1 Tax=Capsaspora owczarzaki (strain ATCC 30864) TaxID=595528 RepID=A0A0D2X2F8_CAPO3|nr:hypothetical protein CAOG_03443 [Capsaspora owczarzaki ATCC 30864]KJE92484.1 hypothetical protein, variant [Capsaspora owczarzaki ATCC 30864]|eukprot:XP_004364282.2 hypothetical protein CAOG_03443 [Capsaspora owczarzaki ATCC 30864]
MTLHTTSLLTIGVVVVVVAALLSGVTGAELQPQHSIRPPFSPTGQIPNWDLSGQAAVAGTLVRLTQLEQSKKGAVWNTVPVEMHNWVVSMVIHVVGGVVGGDGIAFWYAKNRLPEGNVYGSAEKFDGLAVILDTYDNDADGLNPALLGFVNDNTIVYDRHTDGKPMAFGQCVRKFRNTAKPFKIEILYQNGELQVSSNLAFDEPLEVCFKKTVHLPTGYYMGISAATGGLSDKHDLIDLVVSSLDGAEQAQPQTPPSESQVNIDRMAAEVRDLSMRILQLQGTIRDVNQQFTGVKETLNRIPPSSIASEGIEGLRALIAQLQHQSVQSTSDIASIAHSQQEILRAITNVHDSAASSLQVWLIFATVLVLALYLVFQARSQRDRNKMF